MINNQTQEATDIINQHDDKLAPTLSLANTGQNVNLNTQENTPQIPQEKEHKDPNSGGGISGTETPPKPEEEKPPEEEKKTQGQYQTELNNINQKIEDLEYMKDFLRRAKDKKEKIEWEETLAFLEWAENNNIDINEKNQDKANEFIDKELSKLYDEKENITYNSDYDPRPYNERREDTSTQRKRDDFLDAGINPAALAGFYGGGGGGGGGSQADQEEEKRKRRKKELEAQKAREEARKRQQTMQMLNMLGYTATGLATSGITANAIKTSGNIRAEAMVDSAKIRKEPKKRISSGEPSWLDEQIANLGK